MSALTPTISSNYYGFDYYEVAYTCLGAQYPEVAYACKNSPNQEMSNTCVNNSNCSEIATFNFPNISFKNPQRNVITINDIRANGVIPNSIGVEFYTKSYVDALDMCKSINYTHTHIGNSDLWYKWWKALLYSNVPLRDFFQLGLSHSLIQNYMTPKNEEQFIQWMIDNEVCGSEQSRLINLYNSLSTIDSSSIIDNVMSPPVGVYLVIENIDTDPSESPNCVSPYNKHTHHIVENCNSLAPRFDFININGRFIIPDSTFVIRSGLMTINASDIFNSCGNSFNIIITYNSFLNSFDAPYGACCAINNGPFKNWVLDAKMDNPYGITFIPRNMNDASGQIDLVIPHEFYVAMQKDPTLLTQQFKFEWSLKLIVSGECLAQTIIDEFRSSGMPYSICDETCMYYLQGCGIVLHNMEGFSNGTPSNAFESLYQIKRIIRYLFENTYNCHARDLSVTQAYGDLIRVVGRLEDAHGSECWFLLKQVLRPTIELPSSQNLDGFSQPNTNTLPFSGHIVQYN